MYSDGYDANVNVTNNQKTINTGDVIIKAGSGSSTCGINC